MMQLSELASTFNLWGLDSLVANTLPRVIGFLVSIILDVIDHRKALIGGVS